MGSRATHRPAEYGTGRAGARETWRSQTMGMRELRVVADLWRAEHHGREGLARRQGARLAASVAHARAASPFYRTRYRGLPDTPALTELPPVTKRELMAAFDDWVTDPRVTRTGVEAFVASVDRIGSPFLGTYFVCTSSGTTGYPGLFVHDQQAVATYRGLGLRGEVHWLSAADWLSLVRRGGRWAAVLADGGHYAAAGWLELERRRDRYRARNYRVFSVQDRLDALVDRLNAFDPAALTAYPSMLGLLADEQAAGRLRVHPVLLETGGESMTPEARARTSAAFGTAAHDVYGSSEFNPLGFDCSHGWVHVHSDWLVLEPVEADLTPTPAGRPSHTVLLTNLANRVQPILRYDLGDSVLARPDPCPCGCPLPALRVSGRCDDVLRLAAEDGRTVSVPPLALVPLLEAPGVRRAQLVQTGVRGVRLRVEPDVDADPDQVRRIVATRLRSYLDGQGLGGVDVGQSDEPPAPDPRSGKFHQVIAARTVADP